MIVKFIYSEKATTFCEILFLKFLRYNTLVQLEFKLEIGNVRKNKGHKPCIFADLQKTLNSAFETAVYYFFTTGGLPYLIKSNKFFGFFCCFSEFPFLDPQLKFFANKIGSLNWPVFSFHNFSSSFQHQMTDYILSGPW